MDFIWDVARCRLLWLRLANPQALVHLANERFPDVSHVFDVFKVERENAVMWRGTASTFEEAKQQVRQFAQNSPGVYIILNQRTGEKTTVESEYGKYT